MADMTVPIAVPVTAPATVPVTVTRKYKDRLFRFIFSDKKALLELYNALRVSDYDDPDELEINTLDNAIYLGMKNDLSFLIGDEISLFEHQSTLNPNMPLRGLLYLVSLIRSYVDHCGRSLFGSTVIPIPTPHYVVFYNGTATQPDRQTLRLSDAFTVTDDRVPACLEMTALMLNINLGHNRELMEKCKNLSDYAHLVALVRQFQDAGYDLTSAVNAAIDECIRCGMLAEFLRKNRAEVVDMLLFEYNEEEHIASEKEISFEEGLVEGCRKGRVEGRAEGRTEGALETIVQLVCRKLQKGKTAEIIADELGEDLSVIAPICDAARDFAPDYDCGKIFAQLHKNK